MAMGIYRTGKCSDHDSNIVPPYPVLHINLETPSRRASETLEAPIDTGFSGFLLTPPNIYAKLSELELPEEHFPTYSTLAGPVAMRRAKVRIRIFERTLDSFIETPVLGVGKTIVGRRILNSLSLAILGPRLKTCELHEER